MWPVLARWGDTIIYAYPLFFGLAWGVGYRLSEARLPPNMPLGFFRAWFIGLFLVSWVGAKLLFIATQSQRGMELATNSHFWLGGGFVFLGGFLAGGAYTWLVGQVSKALSPGALEFTLVPVLWGHAIGRIGCFLAGCCYGTPTSLPWSVHLHGAARHPVQLYEAMGLSLLAMWLDRRRGTGTWMAFYLLAYGGLRWCLEWLRDDEVRGGWAMMSTSQWVSLAMVFTGLCLMLKAQRAPRGF